MKKAYSDKRKSLFFLGLLAVCLLFLTVSCGLDVVDAVLDDPFYLDTAPPNETSSFDLRTFTFSTVKLDNANEFGKSYIYYKIYNRNSKKESEKNNLENITADSSRRHNAYTTLLNSYSYQPLHYEKTLGGQLEEFSLDNKAQTVSIRLTNYGTDAYAAKITVGNTTIGIPMRINGKTFDFGGKGDYDASPEKVPSAEESSSDVKGLSDTPEDGKYYYVVLYGIFYMPSESFDKTFYSPVHYLVEVKIDASIEMN